jgi:uncharacterized protein YkwD
MTHCIRATRVIFAAAVSLASIVVAAGPAQGAAGFGDVDGAQYYTPAVQWMVNAGITNGSSPGCFTPNRAVTRAEMATFLHRYAGSPPGGSVPFVDVKPGAYYRDAVGWMVDAGITTGTSPTTFSPNRAVTRGEIAAFLYRYKGSPPVATGYSSQPPFADTPSDAFYAEPVQWMVSSGITTGTSATTFEPSRPVTRAEAATFLYRLAGQPAVSIDPGGACGAIDTDIAAAETYSLSLLNQLRASLGVAPLTSVVAMNDYARDWSRTMSEGGFFAHSGGPYGENIVWWSDGNLSPQEAALQFHQMWVDSPAHYANMINPAYTTVGVGLWRDENGWHGTHVFAY